jgi:hypothetical protein
MFDAVEVDPPRARDRDRGNLGGQTLEDRLTGSGGGGRSLRFVMLAGVAAIAVGFGVLAVTFNTARQAPNAATASTSEPKKVATTENAIDMTPAGAPTAAKTEQAVAPDATAGASTAAEPILTDTAPKAAKVEDSTGSDVAAVDPALPPIPRTKPKVEAAAPKVEAPAPEKVKLEKAKPDGDRSVAVKQKPATAPAETTKISPLPDPDDGMFVEEVEKRLATAPRMQEPSNEMSPPLMGPPEPMPLPGADVAGERAAVPSANSTPQRLVPPADIPNAGSYDQAYGSGDYYEPQVGPNGYEYGQTYEEGGWDPEASAVPAPQWVVLGVRQGRAIVDGRQYGVFMVGPGSEIPGVGTVEAIEWRSNGWVVITSNGAVLTSLADSGVRY